LKNKVNDPKGQEVDDRIHDLRADSVLHSCRNRVRSIRLTGLYRTHPNPAPPSRMCRGGDRLASKSLRQNHK